jgi:hypothetical protein
LVLGHQTGSGASLPIRQAFAMAGKVIVVAAMEGITVLSTAKRRE